jgi:DNA segregation ATPase FtsK/SpoIIIE-like protein
MVFMENYIAYLKANKIHGTDFVFANNKFTRSLSFRPGIGTKLAAVEKIVKDFSLFAGSVGVATVSAHYNDGRIKIEWLHTPLASNNLPGKPDFYSVPLGITTKGEARNIHLPKAPHILVAGTTGSGKTYWMHGAIRWALKQDMQVYAIDPKWGEFVAYSKDARFRHLTEDEDILSTVNDLVSRMDLRYRRMAELKMSDIVTLNRLSGKKMDPILLVVDELADLVAKHGDNFLKPLQRLAQKGRAAGIHIICATQAPTAKLLNGELKANFPVRVAFRTASAVASRVILDASGAENLAGAGDGICIAEGGEWVRFRGYALGNSPLEIKPKSIWHMLRDMVSK